MMAGIQKPRPVFMRGIRGELLLDEPMSRHTSWRVGGIAEYFFTPKDRTDLLQFLSQLPVEIGIHWVGLGSNLLVRDGGVKGVVIRSSKGLTDWRLVGASKLYAEAGVACAQLARNAAKHCLSGAEFLSGVPGSFGGALAMNAGAFGSETWPLVESVECTDRRGNVSRLDRGDISFGYRFVELPADTWLLGGTLQLNKEPNDYRGREKIRSLLDKRSSSQPVQSANAGSVFRNPPGDFAARLIEHCGLKGRSLGGAQVSTVHANFIVNTGAASAADIEALMVEVQDSVYADAGVRLEPEVRILGDAQ